MNCGVANWAKGRTMVSKSGDKELITVINPNADKELTVNISFGKNADNAYKIMAKSYGCNPSYSVANGTVTVPANCYVVIGTTDVAAVEGVVAGAASQLRVYGANGIITIDYASAPVEIYSIDGRKVASLQVAGNVEVGSGTFIVVSGSHTRKIAL